MNVDIKDKNIVFKVFRNYIKDIPEMINVVIVGQKDFFLNIFNEDENGVLNELFATFVLIVIKNKGKIYFSIVGSLEEVSNLKIINVIEDIEN